MNSKNKLKRFFFSGTRLYTVLLIVFAVTTWFFGRYQVQLAIAEGVLVIAVTIYSRIRIGRRNRALVNYIESVSYDVDSAVKDTLRNFPLPMVIFSPESGEIITANDSFRKLVGERETLFECSISDLIPGFTARWLLEGKSESTEQIYVGERVFRVFGSLVRPADPETAEGYVATAYWVDVTESEQIVREFLDSRPVFAIIMFDNYDEFIIGMSEKQKSALISEVDERVSDWAGKCSGYLAKFDRDRYIFLFEEQYLQQFIEGHFSILDSVREVRNLSGQRATVSIGIGMGGKSFSENYKFATLGIDMALSRGGDQAVIKNRFSFDFYGGRSSEVEKRTKVKSRVVAGSLAELMRDASSIYIMGHRFADLDCIGAAAGLVCAARKLGKTARIAVDPENHVARGLIGMLKRSPFYQDAFLSPQDALLDMDSNTLLIVVDTNRPDQAESQTLLYSCNHVVVIDHHRRAASYIEQAALSFHEPSASSASELVTELVQYMLDPSDLTRPEAEALMSGIVLDTKNFTLRTGGRTFEAAAFLRRAGADPTEVKKLLQSDISTAMARYAVIQQAKVYKAGIAISSAEVCPSRIVAAQAADELLNISGIRASFVLYPEDGAVCISARSVSEVNVQLIVEKLGGGGNQSTAGAQLRGTPQAQVLRELIGAIDSYLAESGIKA